MADTQHHSPEHLGPSHLGAWHVPGAIPPERALAIVEEIDASGALAPVENLPGRRVKQEFERIAIDLTREHAFPHIAALATELGNLAIAEAGDTFPTLRDGFRFKEAVVQVYAAAAELPLDWHIDGKGSRLVASFTADGGGTVSFEHPDATLDERIIDIHTEGGDTLYIRGDRLYDDKDERPRHAVTKIDKKKRRVTVQFREDLSAAKYGSPHVNTGNPLLC